MRLDNIRRIWGEWEFNRELDFVWLAAQAAIEPTSLLISLVDVIQPSTSDHLSHRVRRHYVPYPMNTLTYNTILARLLY